MAHSWLPGRQSGEKGFTLIELLVVMVIIGILAAVAIPALLGQRAHASDTAAKSDLRNAAIVMESAATGSSTNSYPATYAALVAAGFKKTASIVDDIDDPTAPVTGGFCIDLQSNSGTSFAYNSTAGGLQGAGETCEA